MGKASRRKAALRATQFVVRVGYCDGSEDVDCFASRADAQQMVELVRPMIDEPEGVDLVELIEVRSGSVEFRAVRALPLPLPALGGLHG